jgi:CDP-Glycerol:Poly(glycerophosphate) glycerophosphotransferase
MSARDLPTSSLQYALAAAAVKRSGRVGARRRVAFLIHSPETFSALEPVVDELQRRSHAFETMFFALPRNYTGGAGGPYTGTEATYLFLDQKGLNPIALPGRNLDDLETLIRLCPDFIFRQSPWETDVPAIFNSQMLSFAQLCYVPYGLATVEKPGHQYNQSFHNACDLIFCESEFSLEGYKNHRALGLQGVQMTGYPRFEQFLVELNAADAAWPLPAEADVPRVMWAPHHTLSSAWLGFSTFMVHKDRMLEEARRGRISILLRPHPALRERLESGQLMSGAEYDAYLRAFAAAGCSGVDSERQYIDRFVASDCLITDGLGFFSEYLLTGKPLIRTRRSDSAPLNAFAQWMVEACDDVDDGDELQAVLDCLGERRYVDTKGELRLERQRALAKLAEAASRRVVDALEAA